MLVLLLIIFLLLALGGGLFISRVLFLILVLRSDCSFCATGSSPMSVSV